MTMVDWEIEQAMQDGAIVITPFNPDQLQAVSYDVRIGQFFWRTRDHNDKREHRSKRALGKDLFEVSPYNAPDFDNKINLRPYERVLAHTIESIGGTVANDGTYAVTTKISAKSTAGRCGITVCLCAGYGDPGYTRRSTLEVWNNNNCNVSIDVGSCIAQVEFVRIAVPRKLYGDAADGSEPRYALAGATDSDDTYKPEAMLPRKDLCSTSPFYVAPKPKPQPTPNTEEKP